MKENTSMKNMIKKGIAAAAKQVTKTEVNSTCSLFVYQPQIPESAKRLKKK